MMGKIALVIAVFTGMLMLTNGIFMLVAPESWYQAIPGVSERGPFNQHFIRDIGINYVLIGAAFVLGVRFARQRIVIWLAPTTWLSGHALFHVWEVLVGITGPQSLSEDFAGLTLPALIGIVLVITAVREKKANVTVL